MNAAYTLTAPKLVLTDGGPAPAWLHDMSHNERLDIAAAVASGDYFATLAASLEQVATALPETHGEQYRLQAIVDQLLYLQRHYAVTKKR